MTFSEIIEQAKKQKRNTLTEAESKDVLKEYGIPAVLEISVKTMKEMEAAAEKTGYPVVLKGLGARLTHKTERGLVKINLTGLKDMKKAAADIKKAAGTDLEGFLVQPMLAGKREFVAGLFHDDQFGPVVMFGLGGIFTEAIGDVVFRVAPIEENEAQSMIDELHARKLLGAFRGEEAPDRDALVKTLVGLSRIGMEVSDIKEIDINPLLVAADGKVTAVDALVVLGKKANQKKAHAPVSTSDIGRLFHPQSIAFIGASASPGKWGQVLFSNVVAGKYQGKIYLINPKGGEIAGRPVFKSVTEIPDPVDLAVMTIPASRVLAQIPELKQKGIKNVLLVSAGFGEAGDEGKALEEELVRKAREAGILILGPNTMGICNPHLSFYCTAGHFRPKAGDTTLVAQSGNLGMQLLAFAEQEGIGIRAFSGSGNEAMLTIEDYMDAFEVDELAKTVVLYIEGVKDGRRFFESAKRVGKRKPVIALKGGRTQAGASAAASHTGAMASDVRVYEAACRQAGIIQVEHSMDLLDLSAAFSSLPLPRGNRVGMMTLGGGWGVVASDLCLEYGLEVPKLSEELISRISKRLPDYWSHSNPVDVVAKADAKIHMAIVEELLQWPECDAVIHMGSLGQILMRKSLLNSMAVMDSRYAPDLLEAYLKKQVVFEAEVNERTVRLMEKYQKPVVGVYWLSDEKSRTVTEINGCQYKGINFTTPERAVKALAKMYQYVKWRQRQK